MKKTLLSIAAILVLSVAQAAPRGASEVLSGIVPAPLSISEGEGYFNVKGAKISCTGSLDEKTQKAVEKFANTLGITSGKKCRFSAGAAQPAAKGISFTTDSSLGAEAYRITISPKCVLVEASAREGFLFAIQTIKQMLPVAVYGTQTAKKEDWTLPCCTIEDSPRFGYRGLLLDCGRHFYKEEDILRYLDIMAVYKYNRLHWHLTEDQGWRIEIKKYPRLTEVGAWRSGTQIAKDRSSSDGVRYGGFYTQEQIRRIVAYADELGITIVPEFDIPGHTQALLAAYPEFGSECSLPLPYEVMTHWGVSKQVLNVGKEGTLPFIKDIYDEILDLFPSEYICIGGDECGKDEWKADPFCQAKIRELGFEPEGDVSAEQKLQNYFVAEVMKHITAKGRKVLGADDLMDGGQLEDGVIIMAWRGTKRGIAAANRGIDVLMLPKPYCFLDFYQLEDRDKQPLAIGGYVSLSKAYSFNPTEGLDPEAASHIKGVQAQMWTEYVATPEHLEYMMFPRVFAISEVQWCSSERKDYTRFLQSVEGHQIKILELMGYNYCKENE
ncbi:MAG: beta-N-acetylhexosaminidase [Bacteroidales bacterium]|nr:beta-N-acetylhexosaminidase [Candidatus Cryptobacteroides aphodequi]